MKIELKLPDGTISISVSFVVYTDDGLVLGSKSISFSDLIEVSEIEEEVTDEWPK